MTPPEDVAPAAERYAAELAEELATADEDFLDRYAAELGVPDYPEGDVDAKRAYLLEVVAEEPEPEPVVDDEPSSTAIIADLERENTRHRKAFAKALGVDVEELHDCPTCEGVGFTPEPVEAEPEIPFDPFLQRCERCNGTARVRTGATSLGLDVIPCPACQEKGYVQLPEQPTAGAYPPNGPPQAAPVYPTPIGEPGDTLTVAEARARGYLIVDPTPPVESPAA